MDPRDPATTTRHVHRAQTGDPASRDWIVRRFTPVLMAQAEFRLGQGMRRHVDPADLVQDVWAMALPRLPELGASSPEHSHTAVLMKFLGTTLVFRFQNLVRQQIRRGPATGGDNTPGPALDAVAVETRGAVTRAIASEAQRAVRAAIEALPAADREVVVLRGIEQNSNRDVATILEQSTNAVSLRYNRALKRLATALPRSVFADLLEEDVS